jgi:hypothetical protein
MYVLFLLKLELIMSIVRSSILSLCFVSGCWDRFNKIWSPVSR